MDVSNATVWWFAAGVAVAVELATGSAMAPTATAQASTIGMKALMEHMRS